MMNIAKMCVHFLSHNIEALHTKERSIYNMTYYTVHNFPSYKTKFFKISWNVRCLCYTGFLVTKMGYIVLTSQINFKKFMIIRCYLDNKSLTRCVLLLWSCPTFNNFITKITFGVLRYYNGTNFTIYYDCRTFCSFVCCYLFRCWIN